MLRPKNPNEPIGLTPQERTDWRKSHGICTKCATNPICYERSRRVCEACLEADRLKHQARYAATTTLDGMLVRYTHSERMERAKRLERFERCIDNANALGMSYGQYMAAKRGAK